MHMLTCQSHRDQTFFSSVNNFPQMASSEQLECADFIKRHHSSLREACEREGADEAWKSHLEDEEKLGKYARSMAKLAAFWKRNNSPNQCRNNWIESRCRRYFLQGDCDRIERKELRFSDREKVTRESIETEKSEIHTIRVLDVGSCYNPLAAFPWMEVMAVDLCPSHPSVLRGDFLAIGIGREVSVENDELKTLPKGHFDVVVFSLLLEYLPCKRQRLDSCSKAKALLREGGLFVIVTPDSNRDGANWRLMADWSNTLASLGFMRAYYDKLDHVHCMAFRSCRSIEAAKNWARVRARNRTCFTGEILIPQDFRDAEARIERESVSEDRTEIVDSFEELPNGLDLP